MQGKEGERAGKDRKENKTRKLTTSTLSSHLEEHVNYNMCHQNGEVLFLSHF